MGYLFMLIHMDGLCVPLEEESRLGFACDFRFWAINVYIGWVLHE
jgi:hypothetical protein